MKKLSKSVVCIFMTIVVVISILPVSAFAAFPSINRTDYWSFPTPDSTLSFGRNGDDVRWLQCALNNLILFGDRNNEHRISPSKKLDVDGAFGNATRDAVREFQKQYKLTQDGLFGSKSRDMMINVLRPHNPETHATNYHIDGTYYIRNKQTNKYLDVCGGKNVNGARIVQYQFHGDTNQQFEIKYENGFYKIYTKLAGNRRCLDLHSSSEANTNDTDLQLCNAASIYKEQNFILKRLGDGSYEIGSACSNGEKVLEVANSSYSDGAAVQIWQGNGSKTSDDWYLEPVFDSVPQNVEEGNYYIRNKKTGKYLDVMGGSSFNNAKIVQYHFHGDPNQQFRIRYMNGYYKIFTNLGGSRCLDLSGLSEANTNGTALKLYDSVYSNQQYFRFRDLGDGSYEIGSVCSYGEKVLEVKDSSNDDCATVQIMQCDNSRTNDDWYLEPVDVKQAQERVKSKHQYESEDAAAIDFIKAYNGMSFAQNREYGSTIYKLENGKYTFTHIIWGPKRGNSNSGKLGDDNWREIIQTNPSDTVAYVHTHGKNLCYENLVFSGTEGDVDTVEQEGSIFTYAYLGNAIGEVYRFKKGQTKHEDWEYPKYGVFSGDKLNVNLSWYVSHYSDDTDVIQTQGQNSGEGIYRLR